MTIRLMLAVLLVELIAWEYAPAMRGGFVYEDASVNDACVIPPVSGPSRRGPFMTFLAEGRPGFMASWCAQRARQHSVFWFHAVNVALHLVATGLVGAFVWTVMQEWAPAFLAAAFFGLNAVNVEAVAYLSGRSELLAALGVLGACLAALHQRWWVVVPLILLGVWGKESAIVAVLLVPLCLWYQRGRAWAWIVAATGALLGLVILWRVRNWWVGAPSLASWALLQTSAVARVTVLSLLPFGQTVDYDYARVPIAVQAWSTVMLVASVIWAALQRRRLLLYGVAWAVCACAPRLLVPTPRSVFPEHQFYLPLVGVSIILASLLTQEPRDHYRAAL